VPVWGSRLREATEAAAAAEREQKARAAAAAAAATPASGGIVRRLSVFAPPAGSASAVGFGASPAAAAAAAAAVAGAGAGSTRSPPPGVTGAAATGAAGSRSSVRLSPEKQQGAGTAGGVGSPLRSASAHSPLRVRGRAGSGGEGGSSGTHQRNSSAGIDGAFGLGAADAATESPAPELYGEYRSAADVVTEVTAAAPSGELHVSLRGSQLQASALLAPGAAATALQSLRSRFGRVFDGQHSSSVPSTARRAGQAAGATSAAPSAAAGAAAAGRGGGVGGARARPVSVQSPFDFHSESNLALRASGMLLPLPAAGGQHPSGAAASTAAASPSRASSLQPADIPLAGSAGALAGVGGSLQPVLVDGVYTRQLAAQWGMSLLRPYADGALLQAQGAGDSSQTTEGVGGTVSAPAGSASPPKHTSSPGMPGATSGQHGHRRGSSVGSNAGCGEGGAEARPLSLSDSGPIRFATQPAAPDVLSEYYSWRLQRSQAQAGSLAQAQAHAAIMPQTSNPGDQRKR